MSRKINLAIITLSMGQGGIENLILSIIKKINRTQFYVYLYVLDYEGDLYNEAQKLGIQTRYIKRNPGLDIALVFRLILQFRKDKIDIVHSHNEASYFYSSLAALFARVPVNITTEHSRHYINNLKRRKIEKKILSYFTKKIVTVSRELEEQSILKDKINPKKIITIQNGIDIEKFQRYNTTKIKTLKKEMQIGNENIITIIARLDPIKNHILFLKSIVELIKINNNVKVLIVGEGPDKNMLMEKTKEWGLKDIVMFCGIRNDIPGIFSITDVLVLTSKREGLPLVLLESMAAKVPIVLTKGANRSKIIKPNKNGMQVNDNPKEIAKKIQMYLDNDKLKQEHVNKNFRYVKQNYSIERTFQKYVDLYNTCLSE